MGLGEDAVQVGCAAKLAIFAPPIIFQASRPIRWLYRLSLLFKSFQSSCQLLKFGTLFA